MLLGGRTIGRHTSAWVSRSFCSHVATGAGLECRPRRSIESDLTGRGHRGSGTTPVRASASPNPKSLRLAYAAPSQFVYDVLSGEGRTPNPPFAPMWFLGCAQTRQTTRLGSTQISSGWDPVGTGTAASANERSSPSRAKESGRERENRQFEHSPVRMSAETA
jgi:hypothetical protein